MTAPVTVSPESSIFSETRGGATSGAPIYIGANPTAAMIFGGAGGGGSSWTMPAMIAAAALVAFLVLRPRRR